MAQGHDPFAPVGDPRHPASEGYWWLDDEPELDVVDVAPAPEDAPEADGNVEAPDPEEDATVPDYHDDVPEKAGDVVAWIGEAEDSDDAEARARAALEVERQRDGDMRKTVVAAIESATGETLIGG
jgi:hypothetical protein